MFARVTVGHKTSLDLPMAYSTGIRDTMWKQLSSSKNYNRLVYTPLFNFPSHASGPVHTFPSSVLTVVHKFVSRVTPYTPIIRLENSSSSTTRRQCAVLRQSCFTAAKCQFSVLRDATLAGMRELPLLAEIDHVSNYLATVDLQTIAPWFKVKSVTFTRTQNPFFKFCTTCIGY